MRRSPIPRAVFASLPVIGGALAALAGMLGWPMLLSLSAGAVIALSSAIIYWSRPLEQVVSSALPDATMLEPEALEQELNLTDAPVASGPAPANMLTPSASEPSQQDLLTGLSGPECFFSHFTARLEECRAAQQTAVLVICDLDQFGELNQTVGLAAANRLLRAVAEAFRLTVREGDLLGRLGADEFALFFPGLSPAIVEPRVRDLRAAVRDAAELTLQENPQRVTISVGIGCFPRDGEGPEALFEAADIALQAAKRQSAGRVDQSVTVLPRMNAPITAHQ